jgi:enoyl-CoA hydratase/carnithine racemase
VPDTLLVERHDAIAELVIDRPAKHNALTVDMWRGIPELVGEIEGDAAIRVVIVRGSTAAAFCAGADLAELAANLDDPEWGENSRRAIADAFDAIRTMALPTIALVRGVCSGGGVGIALACDIRVADSTATFSIPPARLGLVYPVPETLDLIRAVGAAQAKRLLFTARTIDAAEALGIGFVDELVDDARERAHQLAGEIVAGSPHSVRAMKRLIGLIQAGQRQESDETRRLATEALASGDHAERVRAFVDRRPPRIGSS